MFTAYAMLTSGKYQVLDFGAWNCTHHTYMLGVYSHLVMFGVGYAASLFFRKQPLADDSLTIYGYLADRRAAKAAKNAN